MISSVLPALLVKKQKNQPKGFPKGAAIGIGAAVTVVALIAYFGINALTPVNSSYPVFAAPRNNYIKALHVTQGYVFVSQSTTSGKKSGGGASTASPTIHLLKGGVEAVHVINEDKDPDSLHNFNINAFNVHTRDLKYFESQSVTFIADKDGTFEYYCTIHPEMRGAVVVEEG